jgi:hypothetical protein
VTQEGATYEASKKESANSFRKTQGFQTYSKHPSSFKETYDMKMMSKTDPQEIAHRNQQMEGKYEYKETSSKYKTAT